MILHLLIERPEPMIFFDSGSGKGFSCRNMKRHSTSSKRGFVRLTPNEFAGALSLGSVCRNISRRLPMAWCQLCSRSPTKRASSWS